MTGDNFDNKILLVLRDLYPVRVDRIVLITEIQKSVKDISIDQLIPILQGLKDRGLIEEISVKTPFDKTEIFRYKISSQGMDYLHTLERDSDIKGVSPQEIESHLVNMYDRIKADIENMRQNLETNQKTLEDNMNGMHIRITDHDQVIRTYFVRVIETFGVFVGIFAVVVVMMISSLIGLTQMTDPSQILFVVVWVPISLVGMIISMLLGIKYLIITTPR